ncbi:MAG TPA: OmpA family protein [Cyclobacteriaceae bacterium]|jgi:OOP family OmpA-OmpF porin|nr:OmpA family protein [Cytophagales bacterium]HRE67205.1 OmpA family protein [Cyclobacteriaceae bacterium]HRF35277.1 OmpA family protein [Cyclobacteriaceae bacterium]
MILRLTLSLLLLSTLAHAQFDLVNSGYDEQNPVISPDGKTLYVTIANHPQNIGGVKDPGDIWVSVWANNEWTTPVHGGLVLNNRGYNAVAGLSQSGNELFLFNHYTKNGDLPTTQGISVCIRTNAGWSAPKNITIPYFKNRSEHISGQWHENLQVIVMAAESYNSLGAEDLYVSFYLESRWSEPTHLGNLINTPLQEMSPSLSEDGRYLFFASNGRKGGSGSFDIYMSERLDDTWKNWSIPVNLGIDVNSDGRELYFKKFEAQNIALFTSTHNSDGYGDIRVYHEKLPEVQKVDTLLKIVEAKREYKDAIKRVTLSGRVTNSKTGVGIPARIILKADSTYIAEAPASGNYSLVIPSTRIYTIEVDSKGYINLAERLDIHTFELETLEMNFKLQPIEVGASVNLKSVLFELGTTVLLDESYSELNVVVDFLNANPRVEIELEGHTDNRGDRVKNLLLSQQRVDKIKAYLVSKGINAKRIRGKGYGGSKPVATNDSEEARKLNRRVEFRILKN